MHAVQQLEARLDARTLGSVSAEFAGQIATAVWLRKLTDEAAREALWSYAMARHAGSRRDASRLLVALTAEYRRRRERQDACS